MRMAQRNGAQDLGKRLRAALDVRLLDDEFQRAVLLRVNVDDPAVQHQAIPRIRQRVVDERLFRVGGPGQVATYGCEPAQGVRKFEFQRMPEEGRGNGQIPVAGTSRSIDVEIDRIGQSDGLGEEAQPAALYVERNRSDLELQRLRAIDGHWFSPCRCLHRFAQRQS
jgi:hypothetical protein